MDNLNMLVLLIIVTSHIRITEEVWCNPYFGPNGARHCIKLRQFDDYQWATCRRDTYIRQKTNNKHICRNFAHSYCYYQCMLEAYGKNRGDVYGGCRCSPETPSPTTPHPTSSSNVSRTKTGVIVGSVIALLLFVLLVFFYVYLRIIKGNRGNVGSLQTAAGETVVGRHDRGMPRVFYFENRPPSYSASWMAQSQHFESKPPPYLQSWLPPDCRNGPPPYSPGGPPQVVYSESGSAEQPPIDSSTTIPNDANVPRKNGLQATSQHPLY